jgi:hypothetical protein
MSKTRLAIAMGSGEVYIVGRGGAYNGNSGYNGRESAYLLLLPVRTRPCQSLPSTRSIRERGWASWW